MEVLAILVAIVVACGVPILVILGVATYLKKVARAYSRNDNWVKVIPRVGLPLFLGHLGCHAVSGTNRLPQEMVGWDQLISVVSVVLAAVALTHLFIATRVRRGGFRDGSLLAALALLAFCAPALAWLLCCAGSF